MADPADGQAFPPLPARGRRAIERSLLSLLAAAFLASTVGPLVFALNLAAYEVPGAWTAAAGMLFLVASAVLANPNWSLRTIGATKSGGERYDRDRRWKSLKRTSGFLHAVVVAGAATLAVALLERLALVQVTLASSDIRTAVSIFDAVLGFLVCTALYQSLRAAPERFLSTLDNVFFIMSAAAAGLFALVAAVIAWSPETLENLLGLRATDVPFLLLASGTAAAIMLFESRAVPSIYAMFAAPKDYYRGRAEAARSRSVLKPALIAFLLLFLLLGLLLLFEIGVIGRVDVANRQAVLLGIFGTIAVALVLSVAVTVSASRNRSEFRLYRQKRSVDEKRQLALVAGSGSISMILLGIASFLAAGESIPVLRLASNRWLDFFSFAILFAVGPYGFWYSNRAARIRRIEERLPDFLRALAASRKGGLTLEEAVRVAAKGEYGDLSIEIQKMADQLSWNIPFDEALQRFGERVGTPLARRAVTLIREASRTGGHVTDVLAAAASDAREIKNLENERRIGMSLYTIIIYITFFVFLFTVAVLYGTFVPQLIKASSATSSSSVNLQGLSFSAPSKEAFRTFYFLAALVQGVGNGAMAGILGSGRALAGLRHCFVMVAITYATFSFVV